ncbi:MAG: hypothetical protein K2N28_05760 [Muribaculaceae bacterium]|nr:hypothetical protein [Muribaculaceae bacterium]
MTDAVLTESGKKILIDELEQYYRKFGSMNKNDFEVLLFYALLESGNKGKRNFELSRILRIPESKVKRLRYEVDLKYAPILDADYRTEKLRQLNERLKNVVFKKAGNQIEFVVEDVALRRFIDNILKEKNSFSDSSFNNEIVRIGMKDLEIILRETSDGSKECDRLLSEAKKLLKKEINLQELLAYLLEIGANTSTLMSNATPIGLIKLLPTVSHKLIEKFKSIIK